MKSLLQAVQSALKAVEGVRDADVYLAPDAMYLPDSVKSPAVGIKDYGTRRVELAGGMLEVTRSVMVIAWVRMDKAKNALLGVWATGQPGVLDLAAEIQSILDENLLGLEGCEAAFGQSDSPSETVFTESAPWQRMELVYQYTFEEERP